MLWIMGLGALAVANIVALVFVVPKFERVFQDMVPGGPEKLPVMTRSVIAWARATPLCQIVITALAMAGIVPVRLARKKGGGTAIAALCTVLLLLLLGATLLAMYLPMVTLIQQVDAKP